MILARTISETRAAVAAARRDGQRITFVPTMGALHAGHVSLLDAAVRDGGFLVVSIFVNPTQFGPGEDFDKYPRDEARDLEICKNAGAALVFLPAVEAMYPPGAETSVHVAKLTDTLCGAHRPGHFDGVTTVVAKLFNIVEPDAAYFGQKDAQQLAVIRQMTRDLDLPVDVIGCPTVREDDGVALSSRNAYLTPAEREQAGCLNRSLGEAQRQIAAGEQDAEKVRAALRAIINAAGPCHIDYAEVVDPQTMQPVAQIDGPVLVALAVRIGSTRLIDNLQVDPRGGRD